MITVIYTSEFMSLCSHSLRNVGNVVASEQRSLGHLRDLSVCIFWFDRRLLLSATIQDDARSGMEKSRSIGKEDIM